MRGDQNEDTQVRGARAEHHFDVFPFILAHVRAVIVDDTEQRFTLGVFALLFPPGGVRHLVQGYVVNALVLQRAGRAVQHENLVKGCRPCGDLQTEARLAPIRRRGEQHAAIGGHREVVLLLRALYEALFVFSVYPDTPTSPLSARLRRHVCVVLKLTVKKFPGLYVKHTRNE